MVLRVGIVGTMKSRQKKPGSAVLAELYAKRQVRRPHYLAQLMERHGVTRQEIIEAIEVDKSLLSRWLDEDKPSTPSPEWARKLGEFFGKGGDPVDIFANPDVDWMSRLLQGRSSDEIQRIKAMIEAAFPAKRA